eukprot:TRINITY_DN26589_c0_g1_i1.p2 TRINITY_DN26589_c0_g1~~TRINITY_DN26589_c0_g1_i1.p2  ORF type:complete len:327 (-),score=76.84 TRINITY_DN26589_c0_g1_i1:178-1158(-)
MRRTNFWLSFASFLLLLSFVGAQCGDFTFEYNANYQDYGDINYGSPVANMSQCCTLCMSTSGCTAFSYHVRRQLCFTRTSRGNVRDNSNYDSAYIESAQATVALSAAIIWIPIFAFLACACVMAALACIAWKRRRMRMHSMAIQMHDLAPPRVIPANRWEAQPVCMLCADAPAIVPFACGHRIACPQCAAANGMHCPICSFDLEPGTLRPDSPGSAVRPPTAPPMPVSDPAESPQVAALVAKKLKSVDEEEYLGRQTDPGKMEEQTVSGDSTKMPMCIICFDRPAGYIFIPCGHLCCCTSCGAAISVRCPYCNQEFHQKLKVFADL